jgi:hypothetical protein
MFSQNRNQPILTEFRGCFHDTELIKIESQLVHNLACNKHKKIGNITIPNFYAFCGTLITKTLLETSPGYVEH